MSSQTVSLASLERVMAQGRAVTLPAWLEDQFERDTRQRRAAFLRATALWTCLIFNLLFAICNWLLESDVIGVAVGLDFLLVTPWILFVAWIVGRPLDRRLREAAAASVPVVTAFSIVILFYLTRSPYKAHGLYFVLMTIIGGNTVMRMRHVYAICASVCALVLVAAAILAAGTTPLELAAVQGLMLSGCAFATLMMNEIRERDIRRAYLRTLRDRLKLAEADAQAKRDELTDLGNRRHLTARAAQIWADGEDASPVAAVMLDVDHFKEFNDLYGHPAGDACLKRVAACVTAELRNLDDFAVRYGGEELLLLLPSTGMVDAIRVAERIRRSIEALGVPHSGAECAGVVTASFGVSSGPTSSLSLEDLISLADSALYEAKRNGRNQVSPPSPRDARSAPARSGWAAALKRKAG
ncbi:MAG: diguanylate cyclase [Roseiarcus sp.]|jgi:diguanylate cyclase (GGDEF)-like protein